MAFPQHNPLKKKKKKKKLHKTTIAFFRGMALLRYQLLALRSRVYELFQTFGDLIACDMQLSILSSFVGALYIGRHSLSST